MKHLVKKLGVAVFGIALAVGLTACGSQSKSSSSQSGSDLGLQTSGTLTVGLEGTFQPYSYRKDGKLTGFEVDLARDVAKKMGVKVKFVPTKFDSLIAGLDVNKYDVVINNISQTKAREKKYLFSTPYIYSKSKLAVKKSNKSIKKITDIKGKKVAETTTSNNATDAKRMGATITPTDGFQQSIDLVEQGRVAGTINSGESFYAYLKQKPNANIRLISAGNEIATQKIGTIVTKKHTKLNKQISKAIQELRKDGTLTKLSKKYFGADVTNK
ncbi:transporter substrate-binding domain-containing protein [Lactiplantibacillus mudanjiangensis]|uniref:Amino acid ABC transporter substrate-binding protein [Lactobacillus sp.] n=1 Tax=Lactiplantibacillus mudanjiangensis TaxID=1296538 RepID=A0A660DW05_9LACO|nr:transporter substrate-binding domain-containing protein [Lactiplantibacillus mudanjiangensis]VDG20318.1 amino acid ABC transporter substrate-binding protein [Lactobacillus sp.] [Lactiplantibacillus mudanjiangensis]VDG23989.1 amino acid ABC transporter substrate-binding protein [Lactobacillus sp.] [Lactiplantibacillus mudanjiangensis]VDG27216.1 amino acid ABC transporter substrate-binding protein [Lactobacillus sp.] [Lactiplantibacillus mudanjiangensis]VDG33923.1 amino acid ABC transporter su